MDVLSGRGASINTRPGNKKFRALCFVRKRHFDAGNHAAKRQLAIDVVSLMVAGTDHEPPRPVSQTTTPVCGGHNSDHHGTRCDNNSSRTRNNRRSHDHKYVQ